MDDKKYKDFKFKLNLSKSCSIPANQTVVSVLHTIGEILLDIASNLEEIKKPQHIIQNVYKDKLEELKVKTQEALDATQNEYTCGKHHGLEIAYNLMTKPVPNVD